MDLRAELNHLLDALNQRQIPCALCGGLALAVHGLPRFTQDIDLLIQETDLPAAQSAAEASGFTLETGWLEFGSGTADHRKMFRLLKCVDGQSVVLDLICVSPALNFAWESRREFQLPDRRLSVVGRDGLISMKRLSGRDQDQVDIRQLEELSHE